MHTFLCRGSDRIGNSKMTSSSGRIDVHFHPLPQFYQDAVIAGGRGPTVSTGFPAWTPELALELMDQNGIASAILSISQPGVHFGDNTKARNLSRQCNEFMAKMIGDWPGRFGAFTALPLPDIEGALAEIDYAMNTLKLDGIGVLASYGEKFLGDPLFDPVLALLNQREAVVFVHPNYHPSSRALTLPWPGFAMEFTFDTTRAAVNLMFTGALQRFPGIRFILAHAGGTLPYLAWRLSAAPFIDPRSIKLSPEQVLASLRHFWYDTALAAGRQTFGTLNQVADSGRILFGSDWPYAPKAVTQASVKALNEPGFLGTEQRNAIDRGNVLKLFPRFAG